MNYSQLSFKQRVQFTAISTRHLTPICYCGGTLSPAGAGEPADLG